MSALVYSFNDISENINIQSEKHLKQRGGIPWGLVVRIHCFHCHGPGSVPGQGNECQTLFWGGSKITAAGDCSYEIKRRLLLGRKVMTTLDSILKSRDITLPTKVHLVKALVFPVVMCGCESWTVKKAEC